MALIKQDGKLLLRSGALASGQSCCCGCQTCPDLCGYYIRAQAGSYIGRPKNPVTDLPIESNATFCDGNTFIDYNDNALQAEMKATPARRVIAGYRPAAV